MLKLTGPTRARVGKAISVSASSLEDLTGKPSPASGVKVRLGKLTVQTNASGKAALLLSRAGKARIVASAPGAIRDELTVSVRR